MRNYLVTPRFNLCQWAILGSQTSLNRFGDQFQFRATVPASHGDEVGQRARALCAINQSAGLGKKPVENRSPDLVDQTIKLLNYDRVCFAAFVKALQQMQVAPTGEKRLRDGSHHRVDIGSLVSIHRREVTPNVKLTGRGPGLLGALRME